MKFGKLFSTIEGILLVHEFDYSVPSIKDKYEKHVMTLFKDPSYICGFYLRNPKILSLLHSAGLDKEIVEFMVMDNKEGYISQITSKYNQQMFAYNTANNFSANLQSIPNLPISDDNFRSHLELINSITKGMREENEK